MIFYKIVNSWNVEFSKLLEFSKLKIFRIFQVTRNFFEFAKSQFFDFFFEFSTFDFFVIVHIGKLRNFEVFFQFGKSKFCSKDWQFWNSSSIRYFALLAIFPIFIFAFWYKSISTFNLIEKKKKKKKKILKKVDFFIIFIYMNVRNFRQMNLSTILFIQKKFWHLLRIA